MKQFFCWKTAWLWPLLLGGLLVAGTSIAGDSASRTFHIVTPGSPSGTSTAHSLEELEAGGVRTISSRYFDRGMDYSGSRFRVVSLTDLVRRFDPEGRADAVLLNCFDDYQGILSRADIERFDLQLATRIEIQPGYKKPDWLNPLLVIVPDGKDAPFQERFMTANIRELVFVDLESYYRPLKPGPAEGEIIRNGYAAFKDNCLFCHSLQGVGGNKGVRLLATYDFSSASGKDRFKNDFSGFHTSDNADKQNMEQFVTPEVLEDIARFLGGAARP